MPSTYSARLRLEKQAAGENLNTWGAPKLNTVIDRIDFAIAGISTIALTADHTLVTSNTQDDEARAAILKFTGTGSFTVTIPSNAKVYQVWNACTGPVSVTTGSGMTTSVAAGEIATVACDATNVRKARVTDFGGQRLTGLADPTGAQDAATKAYADALAFTANAGVLPGQIGNAGRFLTTDGAVASWDALSSSPTSSSSPAMRSANMSSPRSI